MTTTTALVPSHTLTVTRFQHLAEVPPKIEWFANQTTANTRRVYRQDIADFMAFTDLRQPEQFRDVTCAPLRPRGRANATGRSWRRSSITGCGVWNSVR
jgi:hypothetical protein